MTEKKTDTTDTMRALALALLNSLRGRYIVSQALFYGIQELENISAPYQETSSIDDMKLLRDELFNFSKTVEHNSVVSAEELSGSVT
jgi:hypothetical protein